MSVTVLTWAGAIGHSALRINDTPFSSKSRYPHTYISWFPADGAAGWEGFSFKGLLNGDVYANYRELRENQGGIALSHMQTILAEMSENTSNRLNAGVNNPRRIDPRAGQERIGAARHNSIYGGDGAGHMERADEVETRVFHKTWVHLPTEITILGLDEAAIMGWWYSFVRGESTDGKERGGYRMISKTRNCASMVMRALIAGGAEKRTSTPTALFAYDPPTVKTYAQKLQNSTRMITISDNADTIPNSVVWQRMSNSSLPFASRMLVKVNENAISRNVEMRELDESIRNWSEASNASRKSFAIINMYEQIGNYLRTKPHGDRTMAVVSLAKRIYLYTKRAENTQLWNQITRDLYDTDGNVH